MSSWKTTVLGICAMIIAIATAAVALLDGDPEIAVNIELVIAEVVTGLGFIFSRDNDKTSEDVNAGAASSTESGI